MSVKRSPPPMAGRTSIAPNENLLLVAEPEHESVTPSIFRRFKRTRSTDCSMDLDIDFLEKLMNDIRSMKSGMTVCKEQLLNLRAENVELKSEIGDLKKLITSLCSSSNVIPPNVSSLNRSSSIMSASAPVAINNVPSYASVLKFNDVVVIKPKATDQNCDATKMVLQSKMKAADFSARGVRNGSNGGIIVQCKTNECTQKLLAEAAKEMGDGYVVSIPQKKNPCVRFYGFSEQLSPDELESALRAQNSHLFNSNSVFKVVHMFEIKKKNKFGAKVEVDPITYKSLIASTKVCIGWENCWVNEELNIRRCFKCWHFNHTAAVCRAKEARCPVCGGAHAQSDCAGGADFCVVCETNSHGTKSPACPAYISRVEMERSRINYA